MALRKDNEAEIDFVRMPVSIEKDGAGNGRKFHSSVLAETCGEFREEDNPSEKKIPLGNLGTMRARGARLIVPPHATPTLREPRAISVSAHDRSEYAQNSRSGFKAAGRDFPVTLPFLQTKKYLSNWRVTWIMGIPPKLYGDIKRVRRLQHGKTAIRELLYKKLCVSICASVSMLSFRYDDVAAQSACCTGPMNRRPRNRAGNANYGCSPLTRASRVVSRKF